MASITVTDGARRWVYGIQKVAVLVGVGAGQRSRVGPGGGWFDWCRKEFGRLV